MAVRVRMASTAKRSTKALKGTARQPIKLAVTKTQASTPAIAAGLRSRIGKQRRLLMKRPAQKR